MKWCSGFEISLKYHWFFSHFINFMSVYVYCLTKVTPPYVFRLRFGLWEFQITFNWKFLGIYPRIPWNTGTSLSQINVLQKLIYWKHLSLLQHIWQFIFYHIQLDEVESFIPNSWINMYRYNRLWIGKTSKQLPVG